MLRIKEEDGKTVKMCKCCGKWKELNKDNFIIVNTNKDGFMNKCKKCWKDKVPLYSYIPEGYKECSEKGCIKPSTTDFFGKKKDSKDGLRHICKECRREKTNNYRKQDHVKELRKIEGAKYRAKPGVKEHYKEYRDKPENKKKSKEYDAKYYLDNTERIKERVKEYTTRPDKQELIKEGRKNHYINNRDRIRASQKDYNQRPEVKERNNKRQRQRRKTDSLFKIRGQMFGILHRMMNNYKFGKNMDTISMFGYTPEELIKHLNKGAYTVKHYLLNTKENILYHIDHIIPLDYYKDKLKVDVNGHLTEEGLIWFRKANDLRNLRVWPASPNTSKGNKLDMDLIKEHGIEDLL